MTCSLNMFFIKQLWYYTFVEDLDTTGCFEGVINFRRFKGIKLQLMRNIVNL